MSKQSFFSGIHLSATCIVVSVLTSLAQTNSAALRNAAHSSEDDRKLRQPLPRRFLGYLDKANRAGDVILEDVSSLQDATNQAIFEVIIYPSALLPTPTNSSESRLRVWLLATNGTALPPREGGLYECFSRTTVFLFKKTQEMERLYGVVVQYDGTATVLALPPTHSNLSVNDQFYFDALAGYSADELDNFESGRLKWSDPAEREILTGITAIKDELSRDWVHVIWDHHDQSYRIR